MSAAMHVPAPGMFCVPTAIGIITGEDPQTVIFPALNRITGRRSLLAATEGEHMETAKVALEQMGWTVRRYTGKKLSSLVSTWAKRFPDHVVLIAAGGKGEHHCLVLNGGKVYDTFEPMGVDGDFHCYGNTKVRWAALVTK